VNDDLFLMRSSTFFGTAFLMGGVSDERCIKDLRREV
jgi:hypothetical protein